MQLKAGTKPHGQYITLVISAAIVVVINDNLFTKAQHCCRAVNCLAIIVKKKKEA